VVILPVVPICRSSQRLISTPNHRQNPPHPVPTRGAFRHRHGRWARDAVDAIVSRGERHQSGRRSRVVLMPRRRHQVGDDASHRAGDGDKKARSPGRSRSSPLKPLRRECRLNPSGPVVATLVCFLFSHARLRVQRASGIPCALFSPEGQINARLGRFTSRERGRLGAAHSGGHILRDAARCAAPQDEDNQTLMVRSAARPRVSNHEARISGQVVYDLAV